VLRVCRCFDKTLSVDADNVSFLEDPCSTVCELLMLLQLQVNMALNKWHGFKQSDGDKQSLLPSDGSSPSTGAAGAARYKHLHGKHYGSARDFTVESDDEDINSKASTSGFQSMTEMQASSSSSSS